LSPKTVTIAIAGKGGTGKTTIAALLASIFSQKGVVLAIDGDPSTNLHLSLGLSLENTVGAVREDMLRQARGGGPSLGMAKLDYLDLKIHECLVESTGIDLLAMGRPEGPGCYCAANNMLRTCIDRLASNYDYVVIDTEAGMEHISRQTTRDVDILLLISDPTLRGVISAVRMKELIGELRTRVGRIALVINRQDGELSPEVLGVIRDRGLELVGSLPNDPHMAGLEARGRPLTELPQDSPLRVGVLAIARRLGLVEAESKVS